jgi:glycosyltransferase involved in cell wall biosynthesis
MQNYLNVSIIIPVYNSEKTIKNTLNKIINEASKLTSEIIVIDDNSTDNSIKIIKEFGKKNKLIELEKIND